MEFIEFFLSVIVPWFLIAALFHFGGNPFR